MTFGALLAGAANSIATVMADPTHKLLVPFIPLSLWSRLHSPFVFVTVAKLHHAQLTWSSPSPTPPA